MPSAATNGARSPTRSTKPRSTSPGSVRFGFSSGRPTSVGRCSNRVNTELRVTGALPARAATRLATPIDNPSDSLMCCTPVSVVPLPSRGGPHVIGSATGSLTQPGRHRDRIRHPWNGDHRRQLRQMVVMRRLLRLPSGGLLRRLLLRRLLRRWLFAAGRVVVVVVGVVVVVVVACPSSFSGCG